MSTSRILETALCCCVLPACLLIGETRAPLADFAADAWPERVSLQSHPNAQIAFSGTISRLDRSMTGTLSLQEGDVERASVAVTANGPYVLTYAMPPNEDATVHNLHFVGIDSKGRTFLDVPWALTVQTHVAIGCDKTTLRVGETPTCSTSNDGKAIDATVSGSTVLSARLPVYGETVLGETTLTFVPLAVPPAFDAFPPIIRASTMYDLAISNSVAGLTYTCVATDAAAVLSTTGATVKLQTGSAWGLTTVTCVASNALGDQQSDDVTLEVTPVAVPPTFQAPLFLTKSTSMARLYADRIAGLNYECTSATGSTNITGQFTLGINITAGVGDSSTDVTCRATNKLDEFQESVTTFTIVDPPPNIQIGFPVISGTRTLTANHDNVRIALKKSSDGSLVTGADQVFCSVGSGNLTLVGTETTPHATAILDTGNTGTAFLTCLVVNQAGSSAGAFSVSVSLVAGGVLQKLAGGACDGATHVVFDDPRMVAVDPLGNAYVTDYNNNIIWAVTPNGDTSTLNSSGSTPVIFDHPVAITRHPSGQFFVSEEGASARYLTQVKPAVGGFWARSSIFGGSGIAGCRAGGGVGAGTNLQFKSLWGLANDGDHTLYGVDRFAHVLFTFTLPVDFATTSWSPASLTGAIALGTCNAGGNDPLHADSASGASLAGSNLLTVSVDGNRIRTIQLPSGPSADLATVAAGDVVNPRDIVADPAGGAWVADTDNHRVLHVNAAGTISNVVGLKHVPGDTPAFAPGTTATGRFNAPSGIALDPFGDLIVVDHSAWCLARIRL